MSPLSWFWFLLILVLTIDLIRRFRDLSRMLCGPQPTAPSESTAAKEGNHAGDQTCL
jgi:hypothetical protein